MDLTKTRSHLYVMFFGVRINRHNTMERIDEAVGDANAGSSNGSSFKSHDTYRTMDILLGLQCSLS